MGVDPKGKKQKKQEENKMLFSKLKENKTEDGKMFDMRKIGKRIAELRKSKNITQMALADMMGISFQAV